MEIFNIFTSGFDKVSQGVDKVVFYSLIGKIKYIYKITYILHPVHSIKNCVLTAQLMAPLMSVHHMLLSYDLAEDLEYSTKYIMIIIIITFNNKQD